MMDCLMSFVEVYSQKFYVSHRNYGYIPDNYDIVLDVWFEIHKISTYHVSKLCAQTNEYKMALQIRIWCGSKG